MPHLFRRHLADKMQTSCGIPGPLRVALLFPLYVYVNARLARGQGQPASVVAEVPRQALGTLCYVLIGRNSSK